MTLFSSKSLARGILAAGAMVLATACGQSKSDSANNQSPSNADPVNLPTGLAQSIQDIHFDTLAHGFMYQIKFNDWQHLEGSDDSESVIFTATAYPKNIAGADIPLKSDHPNFSGSVSCFAHDCSSGTLSIAYNGASRGSLSGTAKISFYQTTLLTFTKLLANPLKTHSVEETAVVSLINSNKLRGGLIEQYRILGGWLNPFQLTLYYGSGINLTWRGSDQGTTSTLTIDEKQNGKTLYSFPTQAGVTYITPNSLEFCFKSDAVLAIGVFGATDRPLSPTQLCQ